MADINTLPTPQIVRQPRGIVKLNDEVVTGWISIEVDNNRYRSADTFRVEFSIVDMPKSKGLDWFSTQETMQIEIFMGIPANPAKFSETDLDNMIYGDVDDITYHPAEGTIELHGRDWTARLIDTKTSEHFKNKTSSEIVTALAARHNMVAKVTKTTKKAGEYYQIDHDSTTQEQSEWDLLCQLAEYEGFLVYVKGKELHFEPKPTDMGNRYVLTWKNPDDKVAYSQSNTEQISFNRALTITKGIRVEIRSWNAKQKKGFTESFPSKGNSGVKGKAKIGEAGGDMQVYKYVRPGLTTDQAQKLAQSYYKQIIAHAMKLDANLPADNQMDCTKIIQVRGTNSKFDQDYYPDSVKRTMSVTEGYSMSITAKNTSPELEKDGGI